MMMKIRIMKKKMMIFWRKKAKKSRMNEEVSEKE